MKKVALVFVLAVIGPSLGLAWLAVRSLRDQQFLLERQQSLLYQGVTDAVAKDVQDSLAGWQSGFAAETWKLLRRTNAAALARDFDELLRRDWPLAQVGFVVTLTGHLLAPAPAGRPEAATFLRDNGGFLANRETVEVYANYRNALEFGNQASVQKPVSPPGRADPRHEGEIDAQLLTANNRLERNVWPQQQQQIAGPFPPLAPQAETQQRFSKSIPAPAEFRQLIGEALEGTLARFVNNKLQVLFWCRPGLARPQPVSQTDRAAEPGQSAVDPDLVFGATILLSNLVQALQPMIQPAEPALRDEICVALLDDSARPVALSHPKFQGQWKRPFVATEVGEMLPHWEVAAYLLHPDKLSQSARTLKLTLGLLITVLMLAIAVGSWLIVADLKRQLTLARQKTDFVSNVSHELKTPLTSIRMFSELLAEGRVNDPAKQKSYLGIITAETARLTRLINNVLDFARLERGEKKYRLASCDLVAVVRETADTFRPHLERNGFQLRCAFPASEISVNADRDALAQVVVNLLSNAEKYSNSAREILLEVRLRTDPLPHAEVQVLDRGLGVPRGCEEKIFEKFYRAHDSLGSGIQGSGLGLTLARQIARAHGGDVVYQPRDGGGSCFSLRLPLLPTQDGAGERNIYAE